jgi:hypothetical protein
MRDVRKIVLLGYEATGAGLVPEAAGGTLCGFHRSYTNDFTPAVRRNRRINENIFVHLFQPIPIL